MEVVVAAIRYRRHITLMRSVFFLAAFCLSALFLASAAHAEPSDEMFDKLLNAPSDSEGNDIALDIWASWMESGSATVDVIMERGVDAQTAGDIETARAFYDRAILIKPDYSEAWNRRASIFLMEENAPKQALEAYREAIRIYPRMQQALVAEKRLSKMAEGQGL